MPNVESGKACLGFPGDTFAQSLGGLAQPELWACWPRLNGICRLDLGSAVSSIGFRSSLCPWVGAFVGFLHTLR